jgi:hypothetical protein
MINNSIFAYRFRRFLTEEINIDGYFQNDLTKRPELNFHQEEK